MKFYLQNIKCKNQKHLHKNLVNAVGDCILDLQNKINVNNNNRHINKYIYFFLPLINNGNIIITRKAAEN